MNQLEFIYLFLIIFMVLVGTLVYIDDHRKIKH